MYCHCTPPLVERLSGFGYIALTTTSRVDLSRRPVAGVWVAHSFFVVTVYVCLSLYGHADPLFCLCRHAIMYSMGCVAIKVMRHFVRLTGACRVVI